MVHGLRFQCFLLLASLVADKDVLAASVAISSTSSSLLPTSSHPSPDLFEFTTESITAADIPALPTSTEFPGMETLMPDSNATEALKTESSNLDLSENRSTKSSFSETDSPEIEFLETDSPEIDSAEINSPEIEFPETNSSEIESPETDSPEIDSPEIDSPEIESHEIDSPEIESPETKSPEIESPEIESPETESPEIDFPEIESPEIESPETESFESESFKTESSSTEISATESPVNSTTDRKALETEPSGAIPPEVESSDVEMPEDELSAGISTIPDTQPFETEIPTPASSEGAEVVSSKMESSQTRTPSSASHGAESLATQAQEQPTEKVQSVETKSIESWSTDGLATSLGTESITVETSESVSPKTDSSKPIIPVTASPDTLSTETESVKTESPKTISILSSETEIVETHHAGSTKSIETESPHTKFPQTTTQWVETVKSQTESLDKESSSLQPTAVTDDESLATAPLIAESEAEIDISFEEESTDINTQKDDSMEANWKLKSDEEEDLKSSSFADDPAQNDENGKSNLASEDALIESEGNASNSSAIGDTTANSVENSTINESSDLTRFAIGDDNDESLSEDLTNIADGSRTAKEADQTVQDENGSDLSGSAEESSSVVDGSRSVDFGESRAVNGDDGSGLNYRGRVTREDDVGSGVFGSGRRQISFEHIRSKVLQSQGRNQRPSSSEGRRNVFDLFKELGQIHGGYSEKTLAKTEGSGEVLELRDFEEDNRVADNKEKELDYKRKSSHKLRENRKKNKRSRKKQRCNGCSKDSVVDETLPTTLKDNYVEEYSDAIENSLKDVEYHVNVGRKNLEEKSLPAHPFKPEEGSAEDSTDTRMNKQNYKYFDEGLEGFLREGRHSGNDIEEKSGDGTHFKTNELNLEHEFFGRKHPKGHRKGRKGRRKKNKKEKHPCHGPGPHCHHEMGHDHYYILEPINNFDKSGDVGKTRHPHDVIAEFEERLKRKGGIHERDFIMSGEEQGSGERKN